MQLSEKIAETYAGHGDPDGLLATFQQAELVVAVTDDGEPLALPDGGLRWVCAFTSVEALARFAVERGAGDHIWHYRTARGADLQAVRARAPLGVAVDLAGDCPMLFPPEPAGGPR